MPHTFPNFHRLDDSKTAVSLIAEIVGAQNKSHDFNDLRIIGLSSVTNPKPQTLTFLQSDKKVDVQALSACIAIITSEKLAPVLPHGPVALIVPNPHLAFAALARELYPDSLGNARHSEGKSALIDGAHINETATIEDGVTIEPGAVIGAHVSIGSGTYIGPNATIGANCQIGRNCSIGSSASIQYAIIGDDVTLHTGARIGQDGFGFVPGPNGLEKMPQLGRVIIQDNVEIGANTTVDRGTLDDTVIGEGTKIDNLVQVGHNVVIGRNCAIAGFAGLSGSCRIGDGCLIGGRVGIADHIVVGDGVQLAATASVMNDIPSGERWAGTPAQPFRAFFKEQATLRRLAKANKKADR